MSRSETEIVRLLPEAGALPEEGVGMPSENRVNTPLPTPLPCPAREASIVWPPSDLPRSASQSLSIAATSPAVCGRSIGFLDIIDSQNSTSDGGASGRTLKIDSGRAVWCFSSRSEIEPSGNGGLPGQQEIKRAAQAVDVRPAIRLVAIESLLGGQVIGRAEHVLLVGHRERRLVVFGQLGQAHVEQLHRAVPVDQAVGRLDVAMDQAHLMGVLQAVGHLGDVIGGRVVIERTICHHDLVQVLAVDVLHHDVMDVAFVVDVVGPHDVRVVELGNGRGLRDGTVPDTTNR